MIELTNDNYYQNKSYFSFSLYKRFMQCEAMALAEFSGKITRPVTEALLIGSYVDAYIEGTLEEFKQLNPEIISTRGPTKGELKSSFKSADEMIERFMRDPLFVEYLQGEKQTILTGTIAGVPVKGKLDILHKDRIVDFKTTKDFRLVWNEGNLVTFIDQWGYDLQGAIYQELVKQKIGKRLPYYIAAVTKEATPDIDIIHIPDSILKSKLQEIEHFLPTFKAITVGITEPQRCEQCDYCKSTKVLSKVTEFEEAITKWQ